MSSRASRPEPYPVGYEPDIPSEPRDAPNKAAHKPSAWPLPWEVKVELAKIRLRLAEQRYIGAVRKANSRY